MWGGDACVAHHRPCPQRATQGPLVSYPQARFLNELGGDLAQHPGAQAAQARLLQKRGGPAGQSPGLHRLLQPKRGYPQFKWTYQEKGLTV